MSIEAFSLQELLVRGDSLGFGVVVVVVVVVGGRRVRVLVAALLDVGRVGLVRAAKVSVAHILAALVVDAGKLLQLVEVLVVAAVLAVAACTSSAI